MAGNDLDEQLRSLGLVRVYVIGNSRARTADGKSLGFTSNQVLYAVAEVGGAQLNAADQGDTSLPSTMLRTVPIDDEPDVPRRDVWPAGDG